MSQADVSRDSAQFTELWSRVTKRFNPKITPEERGREQRQMPGTHTPPHPASLRDLQSPIRRSCSRFPGLNNGDSPGDVEPSQDIFWDSTSPTAHTGSGVRRTRKVEISDIVNRIAPKDVKRKGTESPLLQWISDSAVPCTPEIPVQRVRKRSTRQSSVDDLMKLARQFDKNMQQDKETSEQLHTVNADSAECATAAKTPEPSTGGSSSAKDPKSQTEAELHALFDCSTQKVSGPLSQSSTASARSQETKNKSASGLRQSPTLKSDESAAKPAGGKESCSFDDDDWENDDLLLNDSFVLAMTQNPRQNRDTNATLQTKPPRVTSVYKPDANRPLSPSTGTRSSTLQELCPKPKTTNRSTFKLQSNPLFLLKSSAGEVAQPPARKSDQKAKTMTAPPPDKMAEDQKAAPLAVNSSQDLWEDGGDDDALLYQVCDTVERISNSQPQQVSPRQEKEDGALDRQRKTTAPLPIDKTGSTGAGASKQSPCAFLRSNSLPGTGCQTANLQGWNIPMKGADSKWRMSQSLPGSRGSLGAFSQCRDSAGSFQAGDVKPHTVTAREARGSGSHHTAFKRHVSDSAVTSNKVFITSQMTGSKCSAAEIERKKQEALARRRLRMQNAPKP